MAMSPEVREQLLTATRSASQAFVEDINYFRSILQRNDLSASDIRRVSNELRRILIDNGGDLEKIAPPRIGKIVLRAPHNSPYYRWADKNPFQFFASGGATIFGVTFRAISVSKGARTINSSKYPPDQTDDISTDQFLSQRVLCLVVDGAIAATS